MRPINAPDSRQDRPVRSYRMFRGIRSNPSLALLAALLFMGLFGGCMSAFTPGQGLDAALGSWGHVSGGDLADAEDGRARSAELATLRSWNLWLAVAAAVLVTVVLGLIIALVRRSMREAARRREAELEHQALRAQMDPQFLFHALATIPVLYASGDPRQAQAYVEHVSKLLRLTLETSSKWRVPLRQEIDLLEHYLHVCSSRHPGAYTYSVHVDPSVDTESVTLPPLLLQPLVENAIVHGLVPRKEGGMLSVEIARVNDILVSRIRDNGIGRAASVRTKRHVPRPSEGLALTAERMRRFNRGRGPGDGLRILDLHDDRGRPAGTEVIVRTVIPVA